jgi:hypothetical protein
MDLPGFTPVEEALEAWHRARGGRQLAGLRLLARLR